MTGVDEGVAAASSAVTISEGCALATKAVDRSNPARSSLIVLCIGHLARCVRMNGS